MSERICSSEGAENISGSRRFCRNLADMVESEGRDLLLSEEYLKEVKG